ncbi:stalk domain-containing protein [Paenibacillus paeoniae]|uniref:Copper amine oxidase-like N-terminal domain-containing protein n=1 Tax=Paenibacillus paeoniae TaxID=2292705 RepID=A0A371PFD5_9BACL|nr:stalk domain-containing protein [Paenibacillus paeoniae]REK74218.1 hypothetical protein DX130_16880 [Paenibacillus paeoniae]
MKKAMLYVLMTMLILTAIPHAAAEGNTNRKSDGTIDLRSNKDRPNILTSVSVIAGNGEFDDRDGAVLEASFRIPQGIAVLKDGSMLVTDGQNHLVRKIANGQVSTYAGFMLDKDDNGIPGGGWNDGNQQTALFNNPSGMTADSEGNVYIADTENHVIRKISKDGMVSTVAGDGILGTKDGAGSGARFHSPKDVAVAENGTLYVADTLNHAIRRITPDGQVTTLNAPSDRIIEVTAGYAVLAGDFADGKLSEAKFNEPASIALDDKGNLYVSDTGNQVIRYIDFTEGTVTTAAGLSQGEQPVYKPGALYAEGGYADGSSSEARFYSPRGIAVSEEQGLIIADSLNHTIRYLVNGQVSTIAGVPAQFGQVDGINGHNLLHHPTDVAVLPGGNVLIADSYNNQIRKLEWYKLPIDLPENDQVKVVFENQLIPFDAQPEIVQGRTMVPVSALSERLGYEVEFADNERAIELTKGDLRVTLQVGSRVFATGEAATDALEQREMETAPYIKAGRAYVPLRFFSEAFGADVAWDRNTKTVILREIAEAVDKLPPADRNSREATLDQIKGTVWISQAGGSFTYRAYNGMNLHHGDRIIAELNSSAILITADRKDEITISENSELYISNLSNASHIKHTSFVLWSGLVVASVSPLTDAKDTFKVITPTAMTDVRGTHFMVGIDPVTGASRLFVSSGLVQGSGSGTAQNPVPVYPAQQLSLIPGSAAAEPNGPSIINPADLINQASPAVIEALLKQKQQIDQENAAMLERMKNGAAGSNPGSNPYNLPPYELEQFQKNLENLLANIAKQALDQWVLDKDRFQALIDEANKQSDTKIDLDQVAPLQLTEEQKQQQEKLKQLEEKMKRQQAEQNKQREQQRDQAASLLEKLKQEKERLEQENKKQQEEAAKRAAELLAQKLPEAERLKFEEQRQALERQKQQQEAAQQPQVLTPPSDSAPSIPAAPRAARPAASIEGGSVELNTAIEITTSTPGAVIYYTTDGSTPAASNGTLYAEPIVIEQDTTVKAIAVKSGYTSSLILTVSYTVNIPGEERSEFAEGYPKTYADIMDEHTQINVLVQTNQSGMVYFAVVPRNGAAPTAEQIFAGFDSPDPSWLAYYYADIAADREFHYDVVIEEQVEEYDVYVVTVIGFDGAASKVRKATAITPPIINQPEEELH